MFSSDPGAARSILAGRLSQSGETLLAELPLSGGALGGAGALAVTAQSVWLAQPQLVGAPSVASVPLSDVGRVGFRARPVFGGLRVTLEIAGHPVKLTTPAGEDEVSEFLRVLEAART
ncbi:hypothetical protein ACFQ46_08745 [Kineococcus sp. GCM10028916]|uniref:hypothetical protein n=1 Tax=Kineococcus sp. GCM10028916 TaxID=3273394 RepID=UPI00362AB157